MEIPDITKVKKIAVIEEQSFSAHIKDGYILLHVYFEQTPTDCGVPATRLLFVMGHE